MLETFDLDDKRDTPAGQLSKGMRQRLLIARCLLHGPRLLILDEPADGLDPRGRSDLRATSSPACRERGVTILISSHILRELDDLCDSRDPPARQARRRRRRRRHHRALRGPPLRLPLRLLGGLDRAIEHLQGQRVLIEATGEEDGLPTITLQVQGSEEAMADLLAGLIGAGVRVVTASRLRSRLEDVYNHLSEDRVN
jgi:ABC-2 type transport system ATP-binding protein